MVYRTKYNNKRYGASILEVITVLAIFGILFAISVSVYSSQKSESSLKMATNTTVEALRYARDNSRSVLQDLNWGVKIFSDQVVVFAGSSYSGRNTAYDENTNFPGGMTSSGLSEIVFDKVTGKTSNTGTITISNSYGLKNINVNSYGTISF